MVYPQNFVILPTLKSPTLTSIPLLLSLVGAAVADVPKKAPISRYTGLWTNSPFTSKPPPAEAGPENNPLDDYALIGVSPITAGYRVTLINKKKPDERITVDSGSNRNNFKILDVTKKTGNPLGTVVRMSSGSMTGTVSFDEKLLALVTAQPKAPPQQPGQPPLQPGQPQLQPGQPNVQRQPRPRVVPPPTPQPGGQVQPNQPVPQNNNQNQRPQRRGN